MSRSRKGTPQGGIISPLLANVYLHWFDRVFQRGPAQWTGAKLVHAMLAPVRMSAAQMREAAADGAYIEFVYNGLLGPNKASMRDYADAIRAVGAASCILASDMGQVGNPLHPDGLAAFFAGLKSEGISDADIGRMSKTNPARALGLN